MIRATMMMAPQACADRARPGVSEGQPAIEQSSPHGCCVRAEQLALIARTIPPMYLGRRERYDGVAGTGKGQFPPIA
jgi:hypothetical protein